MRELIERAASDLVNSTYAIALTGAGISTESGIPDFRGPDGIWTKNPRAEAEAYEHYGQLRKDPRAHWEEILTPGSIISLFDKFPDYPANRGHIALAELEQIGILKAVITQNADSLHQKAGSLNVIEYHGSMAKLRCMDCGARFPRRDFDLQKMQKQKELPPRCRKCGGVLKYDGVYFGEPIPEDVSRAGLEEARKCDLMLVCGTSAVVYPFAELPRIARQRAGVTIIEVNGEPTPLTDEGVSDYLVQGRIGEVLPAIVDEVKRLKGTAGATLR
ncbi:MAG: NAD-dependent deacylase, partial [Dehalococcoidia bacterium]|nr:NAD-dependent deacylase [Dehalococcoidia bacterium]